jgi:hypothetical protein
MDIIEALRLKYDALRPGLNEVMRRRWAAVEARALGRGGPTLVAKATGISLPTIRRGLRELETETPVEQRQRRAGGGRKRRTEADPPNARARS